jgi:hypothetical protein
LHPNAPETFLPNRMLPKQWLLDPAVQRARNIARNPNYYGYTDQYMADGGKFMAGGGSGFSGHPGMADGGGFNNLETVFRLQDLDNAGVYDLAKTLWPYMSTNAQMQIWGTLGLPGNGTPLGGGPFAKPVTYKGLYTQQYANDPGELPLASLYNNQLAPTSLDIGRELGTQYNANATRSLGLEAPMTKAQILRTPVNKLQEQGKNANPVPMAGGGMGMAGGMGLEQVLMGQQQQQGTNPALMRTLAQVLTSKTGYKQPYGAA